MSLSFKVLLLVCTLAVALARPVAVGQQQRLGAQAAFDAFVKKYNKNYDSAEERAKRFEIFVENLAKAKENQLLDPTAKHGVTQFSDLTQAEFKEKYLGGFVQPTAAERASALKMPQSKINDLPTTFDWREKGAVTPIKNQGQCGSCWAFSTVGATEGANFLKTGKLTSLSEQQLVDCSKNCDPKDPQACNAGCNGGLMNLASQYIIDNGSIDSEDSYPYQGVDGTCRAKSGTPAGRLTNWTFVDQNEDNIAAALVNNGPLAIAVNAAWFQTYVAGVSCPLLCNPKQLDHGVLLVGYGVNGISPTRFSKEDYWIIKNSWGTTWGELGYIHMCRGKGMCGMNTFVVQVTA